jgi:hypothetical protein
MLDALVTSGACSLRSRARWLKAAKRAAMPATGPIRCPENDDADLRIDWIPASQNDPDGRGEYHLQCPGCGAQNYMLFAAKPL